MTNKNFYNLPLSKEMIQNLNSIGYEFMTPIQEKSLPYTLENKDLIAKAKTGSGKTAAFGITLLDKLNVKKFRIQSMILCPTRELADQVAKELRLIAKFTHNVKITTLCGGVPYKPQVHSLSHQAHIIVGTPGRILKHLSEENFLPNDINTLVLDEADRMLDMGFNDDINSIIDFLPKQRQTLLFSATYPDNINNLSQNIMNNPITVEIDTVHEKSIINQSFYEINKDGEKKDAILKILNNFKPTSTVIFCNTKIACDNLADDFEDFGLDVLVLHSDLEQRDRTECLVLFANKSYPILIATDVAARGLDIDNLDLVINYDLPFDSEVYTHRIGRTARAGKSGNAVSLVGSTDTELFEDIQDYIELNFELKSLKDEKINYDFKLTSEWRTLYINGGKKSKVRAGDILGALTANIGLDKNDIGKIDIMERCSYVAVRTNVVKKALDGLSNGRIKGKYFKIYEK